jgi:hypothetical protein
VSRHISEALWLVESKSTSRQERDASVKLAKAMKKHLSSVAENVGLTYAPSVYPTVVDLIRCEKAKLASAFPGWQSAW